MDVKISIMSQVLGKSHSAFLTKHDYQNRLPVSLVPTCSLGMVAVPGSNPGKARIGMGSEIFPSLTARQMKKVNTRCKWVVYVRCEWHKKIITHR